MKIGISGAEASFSEEAARTYCRKHGLEQFDLSYLITVEAVLAALDSGEIEKGIFPIENSNGGIVYETVYAMSRHNFFIEEHFEIDIAMNLMAKKGVLPEHITKITSHDQALRQCRMYLKRKWPSIEIEEYPDTAKAGKDIAEGLLPDTTAAIASRRAAELYGLDILEASIQDLKFNFTNFIAARKREPSDS